MKNFKLLTVFLVSVVCASLSSQSLAAEGGNEGGHGGGPIAAEFVALAKQIYLELKLPQYASLVTQTGLNLNLFKEKIETVVVRAKKPSEMILIQRGIADEMDFINLPAQNRINIHMDRWPKAQSSQKLISVLHEYFCFLNLECDTFEVSTQFVSALNNVLLKLTQEQQVSPFRYYGEALVSLPLYQRNVSCDPELAMNAKALDSAIGFSLQKCRAENKTNCEVIESKVELYSSSEAPQFIYCKATAISKK